MCRASIQRLVALCLLLGAITGCTVGPYYEKGPKLRQEWRFIDWQKEYELSSLEQLSEAPPALVVWVDARNRIRQERRDLFQKVEVTGWRWVSFEPTFFLWPWNLARTPVGLTGCAFSGLGMAGHYVAAYAGAGVGLVATAIVWPYFATFHNMGLIEVRDNTGFGTSGWLATAAIGILETPLLVLDVPHRVMYRTPLYPVARNRPEFPEGWTHGIAASWKYAWDYQAYPPFIIWRRTHLARADVPGEVIPGGWVRDDRSGPWQSAGVLRYELTVGGVSSTLDAPGGLARIDLRALSAGLQPDETLRLNVTAQTPTGPLTKDFEFSVSGLRAAR